MQNRRDNECLKWSLRALLFPSPKGRKPLRTTSYLTDDEMSVNHSTKWTNESKTIKKIVRIVSNHCFFATKYRDAVRDHCHMTRKYRGAAHYTCNLNLRIRPEQNPIPFFLKGYDAHLLFQEKAKKKRQEADVHSEQHGNLHQAFIDSLNFPQASLDRWMHLRKIFQGNP